jgi:hypothetical protein
MSREQDRSVTMKIVPNGSGSPVDETSVPETAGTVPPHPTPFHVELTPVAVDARPFHALHGAAPGTLIPAPLHSHLSVADASLASGKP